MTINTYICVYIFEMGIYMYLHYVCICIYIYVYIFEMCVYMYIYKSYILSGRPLCTHTGGVEMIPPQTILNVHVYSAIRIAWLSRISTLTVCTWTHTYTCAGGMWTCNMPTMLQWFRLRLFWMYMYVHEHIHTHLQGVCWRAICRRCCNDSASDYSDQIWSSWVMCRK